MGNPQSPSIKYVQTERRERFAPKRSPDRITKKNCIVTCMGTG